MGRASRHNSDAIARRHPLARSRVSNGMDILPGIDGRSLIARRYQDISAAIYQDMGGFDRCSEARVQLIRRFSASACIAEQMEANLANGQAINISEHALLCSTLVRIARRIGLNRRARNVIPELSDYIEGKASIEAPAIEEPTLEREAAE
jgi:hypothetical protein